MDLYAVLGVDNQASDAAIKQAYRKLARQYHPDVNQAADAAKKFNDIQEAYSVLSDPQKRRQYDQFGTTSDAGNSGFGGFGGFGDFSGFDNIDDIFGSVFGGRGRRQSSGVQGDSLRYNCTVSLEEAVTGCKKTVVYTRASTCSRCTGTGSQPGSPVSTCRTCNGAGEVQHVQQTMLGQFSQISTCPTCRGSGKTIEKKCLLCSGSGIEQAKRTLEVSIPGGVTSGTKLRMTGEGNSGQNGGSPGDLYVFITVKDHPKFKRDGDNLYSTITVPVHDVLLGTTLSVDTIDGPQQLVIPEGTQPGTQFRLKDKGVKRLKRLGRGDHYISVTVKIPKLSRKQKEAIRDILV